jgi:hypothetical protein
VRGCRPEGQLCGYLQHPLARTRPSTERREAAVLSRQLTLLPETSAGPPESPGFAEALASIGAERTNQGSPGVVTEKFKTVELRTP